MLVCLIAAAIRDSWLVSGLARLGEPGAEHDGTYSEGAPGSVATAFSADGEGASDATELRSMPAYFWAPDGARASTITGIFFGELPSEVYLSLVGEVFRGTGVICLSNPRDGVPRDGASARDGPRDCRGVSAFSAGPRDGACVSGAGVPSSSCARASFESCG